MPKQHTIEFKREAVRVALTSGHTRKLVAADFKVGFFTLVRWMNSAFALKALCRRLATIE